MREAQRCNECSRERRKNVCRTVGRILGACFTWHVCRMAFKSRSTQHNCATSPRLPKPQSEPQICPPDECQMLISMSCHSVRGSQDPPPNSFLSLRSLCTHQDLQCDPGKSLCTCISSVCPMHLSMQAHVPVPVYREDRGLSSSLPFLTLLPSEKFPLSQTLAISAGVASQGAPGTDLSPHPSLVLRL